METHYTSFRAKNFGKNQFLLNKKKSKTPFSLLGIYFGFLLLLFSTNVQSQTNSIDASWTLDTTANNVDCYYKYIVCNGDSSIFLRFDNRNAGNIEITWIDVVTTQFDIGLRSFTGEKKLILEPGESSEYNCANASNEVMIKPQDVHPAYLAKIKAYSFNVISIK